MTDFKFMLTCPICHIPFQFGAHRYDGKHLPRYDMTVCLTCYSANWDGWAPHFEQTIEEHLAAKKLPLPDRNSKGWYPRD